MNRNWEEEIDVPVGPDNNLQPGGPDLGQPTHFQPRRNRFMFRVRVPKAFTETDEMIWTLTTKGKPANATLRQDYKIDNVVIGRKPARSAPVPSSPETRANTRPMKVEGDKKLTAKVGQPIALSAIVTDDGVRRRGGQGGPGGAGAPGGPAGRGGKAVQRDAALKAQTRKRPILAIPVAALARTAIQPTTRRRASPSARPTASTSRGSSIAGAGASFDPPQVKTWEETRAGGNSPWGPLWQPPALPPDTSGTRRCDVCAAWHVRAGADAPTMARCDTDDDYRHRDAVTDEGARWRPKRFFPGITALGLALFGATTLGFAVAAQQPAAGAQVIRQGHRADPAAQPPELPPAEWRRADVTGHARRSAAVGALDQDAHRPRRRAGVMPPWYIEQNVGIQHYKDDPSLNDDEVAKIAKRPTAARRSATPPICRPRESGPMTPPGGLASRI